MKLSSSFFAVSLSGLVLGPTSVLAQLDAWEVTAETFDVSSVSPTIIGTATLNFNSALPTAGTLWAKIYKATQVPDTFASGTTLVDTGTPEGLDLANARTYYQCDQGPTPGAGDQIGADIQITGISGTAVTYEFEIDDPDLVFFEGAGLLDGDFHFCIRFETRSDANLPSGDAAVAIGYTDVFYDVFVEGLCPDECRFSTSIEGKVIPQQFGETNSGYKCIAELCDGTDLGPLTPGQEFSICASIDIDEDSSEFIGEAVITGWGKLECTPVDNGSLVNPNPLPGGTTLHLFGDVEDEPYAGLTTVAIVGEEAIATTFLFEPYTNFLENSNAVDIYCTGYIDIAWSFQVDEDGDPIDPTNGEEECPPCVVECELGQDAQNCFNEYCADPDGEEGAVNPCGTIVDCSDPLTTQECVEQLLCYPPEEEDPTEPCPWKPRLEKKIKKHCGKDSPPPKCTNPQFIDKACSHYQFNINPNFCPSPGRRLQEDANTGPFNERLQYGMNLQVDTTSDSAGGVEVSVKEGGMIMAAGGLAAAALFA